MTTTGQDHPDKMWLQHYPEEIPEYLDYPDLLVTDLLKKAAEDRPDAVAIRFLGKSITYRKLYRSVLQCASALCNMGIQPGDRVSLMLPNCPQYVIGYYGVLMTGAVVVQTNPLYVERELEAQLNDAGAKIIIGLDLVYPKIKNVRNQTPLEHIIITGIKDYLPFPKNLLYPFVQRKQGMNVHVHYSDGVHAFRKWLAEAEPISVDHDGSADDVAVLQYTGGTTGSPKGVMLTHRNLIVNTVQCRAWMYRTDYGQERSLGIVPFFHVYGMTTVMNFSVYCASTMILMPKFEGRDALKCIDKEKPTLFPGAPTMYIALINDPQVQSYDLSSIKVCLSGSAPLPIEVQQRFEKLSGGRLVEGYGLSETSPVTHANPIWGKNKIGSIGLPWPDTEADILSLETGESLPPGKIGEVVIKGPQVMKGYWQAPQTTAQSFHEGWFLTGDMGYIDEDGYFYIVDRKKDMIIAGGFKVYPREVEEVLYEHPAIQECAVIGVPDAYRGESVKAFLVLKPDHQVNEEELEQYCRKKLASYKVPRYYEFRKELPKSMVGKVLRRILVEEEKKKTAEQKTAEQKIVEEQKTAQTTPSETDSEKEKEMTKGQAIEGQDHPRS